MKDYLLLAPKLLKRSKKIRKSLRFVLTAKFGIVSPFLFPLFLLVVFLSLLLLLKRAQSEWEVPLFKVPINPPRMSAYPIVYSSSEMNTKTLMPVVGGSEDMKNKLLFDVSAFAYVIMDGNSKAVIVSKNENFRFSMASTTKIMTALTALDYYKSDAILTVISDNVEGAKVGFVKGQKARFEDVLYGMLLPSGNDAALVIAQNYPGGQDAFVNKMNDKASKLRLYNTHFSDPDGLADAKDYTTVFELAHLAASAMQNSAFAEVVGTSYKEIKTLDGRVYSFSNLNRLLGTDGVVGVKTGFTDEAGGVLVTAVNQTGHQYIIVVMKSDDRFLDTERLLSFLKNHVAQVEFSMTNPFVKLEGQTFQVKSDNL